MATDRISTEGSTTVNRKSSRQRRASKNRQPTRRRSLEVLEKRNLLAVVTGEVFSDVSGDGDRDFGDRDLAEVRVYVDANDNQSFDPGELSAITATDGTYTIDNVPAGDVIVRMVAPTDQIQSSPQTFLSVGDHGVGLGSTGPVSPNTSLAEISSSGQVHTIGSQTGTRLVGLVQTRDGTLLAIGNNGTSIYSVNPTTGEEALLASPIGVNLAFGLAYDAGTDTVYTVARDNAGSDFLYRLRTVDPLTGQLGPVIGQGLALITPSDLTFDPLHRRIVGFDNNSNRFFEYSLDDAPKWLATASTNFNGFSLAFDGDAFYMVDQGFFGLNSTSIIQVNPDTGSITPAINTNIPLLSDALFHVNRGEVAVRFDEVALDAELIANFGLTSLPTPVNPIDPASFPIVINELLVNATFGNNLRDQYVELRGAPGGTLGEGTYFVVVSEESFEAGEVTGIFDLSNEAFGENGFLTLLQPGSPFQANPASRVLQSITSGFSGLPGNLYSHDTNSDAMGGLIVGPNAYLLIQTDTPPLLTDDIDLNDDGVADSGGVLDSWNVLDSLSIQPDVFSDSFAYGEILIAEQSRSNDPRGRIVPEGTEVLIAEGFGYAGRIGDSVGSRVTDWVAGEPVVANGGDADSVLVNGYELQGRFFFQPFPIAFHSRDLDHVGESNFVGGVRGTVQIAPAHDKVTDIDGNPVPPQPAAGVTVLADTNGNGTRDLLTFDVDPDDAVDFNSNIPLDEQSLTNAFDNVTISTAVLRNDVYNNNVVSFAESGFNFPGSNRIFSGGVVDTFADSVRLRFDFYRPVSQASIEALGRNLGSFTSVGRISAFDANDNLLDTQVSQLLVGSRRQRISVSSTTENIAYVVAQADRSTSGSSRFVRFDHLQYRQLEQVAVTGQEGSYAIRNLFPNQYEINILQDSSTEGLLEGSDRSLTINRYENLVFNVSFRPNSAPVVDADFIGTVAEDIEPGVSILQVSAAELDGQSLSFESLGGDTDLLTIDSITGEISVAEGGALDFETKNLLNLMVGVSDSFTTTETVVTIDVTNVNEPPLVQGNDLFVIEGSPSGTPLGTIRAFDPDLGAESQVTFLATGGTGLNIFEVHPTSGLVTITDGSAIAFNEASSLTLNIRASDSSSPPLSTDYVQTILVVDQNDPPEILSTGFEFDENSVGQVGSLQVSDLDVGQTHTFSASGGTGIDLFDVTSSGAVIVRSGAVVDFEQGQSYTLEVLATDSGAPPLADGATITLTVRDINEAPSLNLTAASVPENSPAGTVITTLSSVDPESSATAFQITLLDSGDAADFDFNSASSELTVGESAALNFESNPQRVLHFRISDPAGLEADSDVSLTLSLSDENDPPVITTEQFVISELALPGSPVGRVDIQVIEPDIGDQVTVALVGGNAQDRFVLESGTRALKVAAEATFDADQASGPLTIVVEATDEAGSTSRKTIEILVNNVNEPPVISTPPPTVNSLASGERLNIQLPSGFVSDPENGAFEVTIFGPDGSMPRWLDFDREAGLLTGIATPETVGTYHLTLRAFEKGLLDLHDDASFTITVAAGENPLTNKRDPLDVDANGVVAAVDALRVINYLNRFGSGLANDPSSLFNGFVDTSGNGFITALDALLVINELKRVGASGEGESLFFREDDSQDPHDEALTEYLHEPRLF